MVGAPARVMHGVLVKDVMNRLIANEVVKMREVPPRTWRGTESTFSGH